MTTLDPDLLLRAYAVGVFPMADSRDAPDVFWVEPKRRGILPLNSFHLSHSLAKALKSDRFTVTADKAFADVMRGCAEPKPDRPETWINERSEEHTSELQSLMRISYAVFCLKKKKNQPETNDDDQRRLENKRTTENS